MALRVRYGQREVNDRPSTGSGAVTIRKRREGWQVIVYAGLDPLTGKQRQLTRQVNGSRRQAEKVEARLRTEVADASTPGRGSRPSASWLTSGSSGAPPATSPSPRTRWRTTAA
jgi:hypothetical protein